MKTTKSQKKVVKKSSRPSYKGIERRRFKRSAAVEKQFITIKEACRITGYAASTLRKRLAHKVPMIGKNSFDRIAFFDYWRKYFRQKEIGKDHYRQIQIASKGYVENNIKGKPWGLGGRFKY
jgi:isocitrate/isopropylmalate dehydrogenase